MVYLLVSKMDRLALRSLLDDGDFVRLGACQFAATWVSKVEGAWWQQGGPGPRRAGGRGPRHVARIAYVPHAATVSRVMHAPGMGVRLCSP